MPKTRQRSWGLGGRLAGRKVAGSAGPDRAAAGQAGIPLCIYGQARPPSRVHGRPRGYLGHQLPAGGMSSRPMPYLPARTLARARVYRYGWHGSRG